MSSDSLPICAGSTILISSNFLKLNILVRTCCYQFGLYLTTFTIQYGIILRMVTHTKIFTLGSVTVAICYTLHCSKMDDKIVAEMVLSSVKKELKI